MEDATNSAWLTRRRYRLFALVVFALVISHFRLVTVLLPDAISGYGDFSAFYTAGHMVRQNAPALYDFSQQAAVRYQLFPSVRIHSASLPYYHPAYEALIYAALATLPYRAAYLTWAAANVIMLGLSAWLLHDFAWRMRTAALMLLAVAYFPIVEGLLQGQDVVLLLFVYAGAYAALKRDRDFLAGLLLALGLFKFHLVVPFVVIVAVRRGWKMVYGFATGGAALVLISVGVTGWAGALKYIQMMLHFDAMTADVTGNLDSQMPSLGGFLATILANAHSPSLTKWMIVATSASLIAIAIWIVRQGKVCTLPSIFSFALVTTIVSAYHVNAHDLTLLFFPLLYASNYVLARKLWAGMVLVALLWFSPIYLLLIEHNMFTLMFWPIAGLLALLGEAVRQPLLSQAQAECQTA